MRDLGLRKKNKIKMYVEECVELITWSSQNKELRFSYTLAEPWTCDLAESHKHPHTRINTAHTVPFHVGSWPFQRNTGNDHFVIQKIYLNFQKKINKKTLNIPRIHTEALWSLFVYMRIDPLTKIHHFTSINAEINKNENMSSFYIISYCRNRDKTEKT